MSLARPPWATKGPTIGTPGSVSLVEDAAASQMRSPAILIVGNVLAACRDRDRSATAAALGDELQVQCLPGSGT